MKHFYTLLLSVFIIASVSGQNAGEWMWVHGSNAINSPGNMGVKGTASPTNEPPALFEPIEWKDKNGNFWFYGGEDSVYNSHNDLWKYDPVTEQWTWMNGTNTPNDPGNYGTRGVEAATNRPPAKAFGAVSWTDQNNNL